MVYSTQKYTISAYNKLNSGELFLNFR